MTEKAVFSNVELTRACPAAARRAGPVQHARNADDRLDRPPRRRTSRPSRIEAPNWLPRRQDADLQQRRPDLPHPRRRRRAARRSTPASPPAATTTTASRPTARCWPSATSRRGRPAVARSTRCRSPAGRPSSSRRPARPTGTAGRPTARRSPSAASATASSTSTRSPPTAATETRLTTAKGLDDGPEYSPDGKSIYFNSDRTGTMQIWRMKRRRQRPGAGHRRRVQQLVPPPLARRPAAGLPLVREGRHRPPGEQGRDAAHDDARRRRRSTCWPALRRPGDDQRPVLVARRPADRVRDVSVRTVTQRLDVGPL